MRDMTPPVTKKRYVKPEMKYEPPPDGTQFRCLGCKKDLFGIFENGELVIRYGDRVAQVSGVVTVVCRKCGIENRIDTRNVAYKINLVVGDELAQPLATKAAHEYAEEHGISLREINVQGKITVREVKEYHATIRS